MTYGPPERAIATSLPAAPALFDWIVTSQTVAEGVAANPAWRRVIERATVHEVLMGAQDNLTNVLAVVLGVTIGSGRADFVALAGLSAGIAEAVSMGGVLYNATRADQRMQQREGLPPDATGTRLAPISSGMVCFAASLVAGMLPLVPFAFLPVSSAVFVTMATSIVGLFLLGSLTGRIGGESWLGEGFRLVAVAGFAAIAAAMVGAALHVA
jgi:VIT1/CCC1 family predicted Fe2+/Mn2+ transporter